MKKSTNIDAANCECSKKTHACKFVVLTGGPGAGKTAVLEMVRRVLCPHVVILPEAAGIVFGGGFLRKNSLAARKGAQRAIYHVQREQERIFEEEKSGAAIVLCDRGTLDCLAYWPNSEEDFFAELNTDYKKELERYSAVIHLRTPSVVQGYNQNNPLRVEHAQEAAEIDKKIAWVWREHSKISFVDSTAHFLQKASMALELITRQLPACCKIHLAKTSF